MPSGVYVRKPFTDEHKRKMGGSAKGNKNALGYKHSDEAKEKIGEVSKGRKHTDKTKRKISENHVGYKGKHHTDKAKRKMSEANKGRTFTDEHKRKLSIAQKGYKHSDEAKRNMSIAAVKRLKKNPMKSVSKSETKFLDEMENLCNIKMERQFILGGKLYDGRYKDILIELDGSYWHSLPGRKENDFNKDIIAGENGYNLIRIIMDSEKEAVNYIENKSQVLINLFKSGRN